MPYSLTPRSSADEIAHLKEHGIDYLGEYPEIPQAEKLLVKIQRAAENAEQGARDKRDGKIKTDFDPEKYWNEIKEKAQQDLQQLVTRARCTL